MRDIGSGIKLVLKYCFTLMAVVGILAFFGLDAKAFPQVSDAEGWEFEIKANEAVVIGYHGSTTGMISMPNSVLYNNVPFPVGAIGNGALGKSGNSIVDGETYTGCNIVALNIPESVDAIADNAFEQNESIRMIRFTGTPSLNVIGSRAFYKCKALQDIVLPSSLLSIGDGCFRECQSLSSITIPAGITEIPSSCFMKCTSLISVNLPSGVETISSSAFSECERLSSINLPNGLNSISGKAFWECTSLVQIAFPSSLTNIGSEAYARCSGINSLEIPGNVKKIDRGAFSYCHGLGNNGGKVTINEGVQNIGGNVFYDTPELKSISIPYSVTLIGGNAFGYYESEAGTRPVPGFTIYGFFGSKAEEYAKENEFTFVGTTKKGIVMTADDAEYATVGDKQVELSSIKTTTITSFTVPKTITVNKKTYKVVGIGNEAFKDCKVLKEVKINGNVTYIGEKAFKGCIALETVVIGTKVTKIEKEAFNKCSKLKKITIKSKKIKSFGKNAFNKINKKAVISVPKSKFKKYKKSIKKSKIAKTVIIKKS